LKRFISKAGLLFLPLALFAQSEKLSLNDAIRLALQNNPDILRAQKEIDAADGRILQAGKIPNPELGISWNETPQNFNVNGADERDIGIVQQIEFPTKRSNRIEVATYDRGITQLNLERIKFVVTARVKKSYYNLLFSLEILNSLEEQLKLLKDFQQLVTARYQAGQSNYLDVVRAKVEITRLGNDIAEARRESQLRKNQLKVTIGRNADDLFEVSDSLSYVPVMFQKDSLLASLAEKSSALRIVQQTLKRQQQLLSLAKSSYFPDFSVGLFHQRRSEEPPFNANQFTGTTTSAIGIQLDISVPLWFWQEPKGQVQEASALIDIVVVNQRAIERRIRASILNAFDFVTVSETQLKAFDETLLKDSQDILATAIAQYQNNQIDVLNLVDVYRTYRATKVEYARSLFNYAVALAELEAAAELPLED